MSRTLWFAIAILSALAPWNVARGETLDSSDPKSGCVMREYPLYEAPTYTETFYPFVEAYLITSAYGGMAAVYVRLDALTVALRTDGKVHTSLQYWVDPREEKNCKKAVLLVPAKDDVAVWQAEIDRWKKMRQDYLDSLPKPRRILPRRC